MMTGLVWEMPHGPLRPTQYEVSITMKAKRCGITTPSKTGRPLVFAPWASPEIVEGW